MTMSISSAPSPTASFISSSLACVVAIPLGKAVADGSDVDAAITERCFGDANHHRINTNCSHMGNIWAGVSWRRIALLQSWRNFAGCVLPFKCGQVDLA